MYKKSRTFCIHVSSHTTAACCCSAGPGSTPFLQQLVGYPLFFSFFYFFLLKQCLLLLLLFSSFYFCFQHWMGFDPTRLSTTRFTWAARVDSDSALGESVPESGFSNLAFNLITWTLFMTAKYDKTNTDKGNIWLGRMCSQNEPNMVFAWGKVGRIWPISLFYSLANLDVTTQVHTWVQTNTQSGMLTG